MPLGQPGGGPPTGIDAALAAVDPRASYLSWSGKVMLDKVTREAFAEALNSTFKLKRDGEPTVGLDLIEATDLEQPVFCTVEE